ncbi:MAG: hypothetical protein WKF57_06205 [Nakamurella sp.]
MSLCRWSTDDYHCDVYIYDSDDGVTIHVAGSRYIFTEPFPPEVPLSRAISAQLMEAWMARQVVISRMIDEMTTEPIGLPHDGVTLIAETPGEAAQVLRDLVTEGYRVPIWVIDALNEEQTELDVAARADVVQPLPDAHGPTCESEASCVCSVGAR